jgi:hypothetical protein
MSSLGKRYSIELKVLKNKKGLRLEKIKRSIETKLPAS